MQPKQSALRYPVIERCQVLDEVDYFLLCRLTGLPREAFPPKKESDTSERRFLDEAVDAGGLQKTPGDRTQ